MARIAKFIGQKDGVVQKFVHQEVKFMETLNIVHWNDSLQTYSDIGMHSTDGVVTKMRVARCRDENGQVIDVLESESLCPTSHPDFLFYLGDGHGGFETRYVYVPGVVCLPNTFRKCMTLFCRYDYSMYITSVMSPFSRSSYGFYRPMHLS